MRRFARCVLRASGGERGSTRRCCAVAAVPSAISASRHAVGRRRARRPPTRGLPSAAARAQVRCPDVVTLDLSRNYELRSGQALAGIGKLSGLKELDLSDCVRLTSLPAEVGELKSLVTLDLYMCNGLMEMPDLSALRGLKVKGQLPDHLKPWEAGGRKALSLLTGEGCPRDATELTFEGTRITRLPEWVAECTQLATLNLYDCNGLMEMPDLSARRGLKVKGLPDRLKPWKAGGRKAYAASARR